MNTYLHIATEAKDRKHYDIRDIRAAGDIFNVSTTHTCLRAIAPLSLVHKLTSTFRSSEHVDIWCVRTCHPMCVGVNSGRSLMQEDDQKQSCKYNTNLPSKAFKRETHALPVWAKFVRALVGATLVRTAPEGCPAVSVYLRLLKAIHLENKHIFNHYPRGTSKTHGIANRQRRDGRRGQKGDISCPRTQRRLIRECSYSCRPGECRLTRIGTSVRRGLDAASSLRRSVALAVHERCLHHAVARRSDRRYTFEG
jgi:hypothetical protein